jgi:hypothetical protein
VTPGEIAGKPLDKKSPSAATNKEKTSELKLLQNIGSRKHAVSSAHSSSSCLLQQRAGLKGYFANSEP